MKARIILLALSLSAGVFCASDASASTATICNSSGHVVSHVIFDPTPQGASYSADPMSGLEDGQCLTVNDVADGPYKLLFVLGAHCSYQVDVNGTFSFTLDTGRYKQCDDEYMRQLDEMFGDEPQ